MKAAVVESFDQPPQYRDFPAPEPAAGEVGVNVSAAALSQLVRAQAAGRHYTKATPPFVPGADGVGRLDDGRRVYFAFPRAPVGAMAERVAVKRDCVVELADDLDDVTAAAIANPGMSSWAALVERAALAPGETVLINGATGTSGRLAIGIARHLGAARIIATGRSSRSAAALAALGADEFIALEDAPDELPQRFAQALSSGVDVVLDYLWGPPARALLTAAVSHGSGEAASRLRFVNIGSLAGAEIVLPAGALRSSGLELMGSGLGSVAHRDLVRSIAGVFDAIGPAGLSVAAEPVPLADARDAWQRPGHERIVFTL